MNRRIKIFVTLLAAMVTGQVAWAADEKPNMAPDAVYKKECGSCHMAYPADLLPARSWQKIMATLDKHFGDNAEFSANEHQPVLAYLNANSMENSKSRRAKKMLNSIPATSIPLRIIEVPYIVHEHEKLPAKVLENNPKLSSLSQCDKCHQKAQKGSFDEDDIVIPGMGRWDD